MGIAGLNTRWGKYRVRTPALTPSMSSKPTHAQDGSGIRPAACPWAKSTVQQNKNDQHIALRIAPRNVGLSFRPYFLPRQYISAEAGIKYNALYAINSNMAVSIGRLGHKQRLSSLSSGRLLFPIAAARVIRITVL